MEFFLFGALVLVSVFDIMDCRAFNKRLVQAESARDKYRDKYNDLRVKYASLKSSKGGR